VGIIEKTLLLRGSHTFSYEPERSAEGILGRSFFEMKDIGKAVSAISG